MIPVARASSPCWRRLASRAHRVFLHGLEARATCMQLRTAIIGCGLIGNKRAKALGDSPLMATADTNLARARQVAASFPGCEAGDDWQAIVERPDVDLVIVATT